MRESNFHFPGYNRASVCVSSGLYDRRALDAPTATLPLVNSLHHLANLTATYPRIREILAGDGGLERLIRILQYCGAGGPAAQQTPTTLAEMKGQENGQMSRRARKAPFKAFSQYDLLPTLQDIKDVKEADVDGLLRAMAKTGGFRDSVPPALSLPPSSRNRNLLYTYTLAFQCVINIGVRGSEEIRTRVVEAGALDVVVYVLERYLEEVERKRVKNLLEWQKREKERASLKELEGRTVVEHIEGRGQAMEEDPTVVVVPDSSLPTSSVSTSVTPLSSVPPSPSAAPHAISALATTTVAARPLLTHLNIVAASSSAGAGGLTPPSRVQTPDTVVSMDEAASLTGDDEASGQEGDEEMLPVSGPSSATVSVSPSRARTVITGSAKPDTGAELTAPDAMDVDSADERTAGEQTDSRASSDREGEEMAPRRTPRPPRPPRPHARSLPRSSAAPIDSPSPPLPAPIPSASTDVPPSASTSTATAMHDPHPLQFRDEDVLMSLQLLAYLSKYPHVRSVFHAPSPACTSTCLPPMSASSSSSSSSSSAHRRPSPPCNVFSLVELFTYRALSSDPFTPPYPSEIQFWAGVIMRNACRKDEEIGGIRQCANMACGKWEGFAREFAKCRRCRRAKYCSKGCQSEAWNNGHRYWCHKVTARKRDGPEVVATDAAAAVDSVPTSGAEGAATPTRDAPLRRAHSHSRHHGERAHRHSRRRNGADEDEEAEEEDLPPPPAPIIPTLSDATPRAIQRPLPIRVGGIDGTATPPPPPAPTGARGGRGGAAGLADGVAVAGEDDGMFAAGGWGVEGGMVDEEQVAREMVLGMGGIAGLGGMEDEEWEV
ncbi:hypothetical protein JCM11641_003884 [Rhodosporidiobolus odoratus]